MKDLAMKKNTLLASALASALLLPSGFAMAAEQTSTKESVQKQLQEKEQVYGSQLMTQEERAKHQAKMKAAKTAEERQAIRKEHHQQMEARAKERGITLAEEPAAKKKSKHMEAGERMGPDAKNNQGTGGGKNR